MSEDGSQVVRQVADDDGYTWVHRVLLQSFLTHGVMTVDELKPVLASIMSTHNPDRPFHPDDVTQPLITSTIQTINAKVEPYNYEIRSTLNQRSKDLTYGIVNKTSDALTQLATRFSPAEIAYIRRLLDYMFETNNTHTREVMALKHNEASQLARPSRRNRQTQTNGADDATDSQPVDQGITIQEADAVLDALVHDAFFERSRSDYYALAPRALMELGPYLKEMYNEERGGAEDDDEPPVTRIHDCEGCRELMTYGIRCNNLECGVRWHDRCANQYYHGSSRDARKCPKCKTLCTGDVYVGERAARVAGRLSTGNERGG